MLVATPFKTEEEALRLANDTSYGLGASTWTRDCNKIQHFTRHFRAGTVWVNIHNVLDMALPFGGVMDSGLGARPGRGSRAAELSDQGQCRQYHLNQRPEFVR